MERSKGDVNTRFSTRSNINLLYYYNFIKYLEFRASQVAGRKWTYPVPSIFRICLTSVKRPSPQSSVHRQTRSITHRHRNHRSTTQQCAQVVQRVNVLTPVLFYRTDCIQRWHMATDIVIALGKTLSYFPATTVIIRSACISAWRNLPEILSFYCALLVK